MTKYYGEIRGLNATASHGFHVHENGDITNLCNNVGNHFNPMKGMHGSRDSMDRHLGDLGNLNTTAMGVGYISGIWDLHLADKGNNGILGRACVVHEDMDDQGFGMNDCSKLNGCAGRKIACGVIGLT
jgi:Cu-Zn family superoxide dismutase